MQHRIVCVDDQESYLFLLKLSLTREGYQVSGFSDYNEAYDSILAKDGASAYVLDYKLKGATSTGLVELIRQQGSTAPIIIQSGTIDEAREALSADANITFLEKPYRLRTLSDTLKNKLEE